MRPLLAALAALLVVAAPALGATDPARPQQWGLDRIHADQAWTKVQGAGVTIAIVDTGIDLGHPDLKGKIASHYDCTSGTCVSGASAGNDDNGHGSHVAGIAAATTWNGIGIAGVAPGAKLMAVKALDSSGSGKCSNIVTGIEFAADHGARVINLSLGPEASFLDLVFGNTCVSDLQNAAVYAWNKGDVVVIAAGNDSLKSAYNSPALEVVGATGPRDEEASYSNTGADIYAPGGDCSGSNCCTVSNCILSTWMNNQYAVDEGTSMATPHVSGVAALLLSEGYSNAEAKARINSTADIVNGIPRLNAARAVGAGPLPSPSPTKKPSPSPTPTQHKTHIATTPHTSATPKPTPKSSPAPPRVLAVGPITSPSAPEALGAPPPAPAGNASRAFPIGVAFGLLVVVFAATTSVLTRRARRA
jgi:subtilisin family serine protease